MTSSQKFCGKVEKTILYSADESVDITLTAKDIVSGNTKTIIEILPDGGSFPDYKCADGSYNTISKTLQI